MDVDYTKLMTVDSRCNQTLSFGKYIEVSNACILITKKIPLLSKPYVAASCYGTVVIF